MKVIVAGSRSIVEVSPVETAIFNSGFHITECVCGMTKGVDLTGKLIAESRGIPVKEFPADWNQYGRKAGPIRNREMGDYADAAIVVWDGISPGSLDMAHYMVQLKKRLYLWHARAGREYHIVRGLAVPVASIF